MLLKWCDFLYSQFQRWCLSSSVARTCSARLIHRRRKLCSLDHSEHRQTTPDISDKALTVTIKAKTLT